MPLPCKFPLRSFLVLTDIPELSESGLFLLPCKFPLRNFLVLADIPELSESGLFLLPCKFPLRTFLVLADIPELSESGLFLLPSPGTGSHPLATAEGSPQPHSSGHHYKIKGSKLSVFFVVPKLRKSQD